MPERQRTKSKDYRHRDPRGPKIIKPTPSPRPSSIEPSNRSTPAHRGQSAQTYQPKPAASPALHQQSVLSNLQKHDQRYPGVILQPESRPISQEQLASEVKSIYAGLSMVESKCIHVDRGQAEALRDVSNRHSEPALQDDSRQPPELVPDHWQALIALHRTLLHEHHDFFLASQHPSASPALRRLAAKYSMPARMWKHGIHSFLELLRQRLPASLDFMLAFIYLSYQMMALLYETVPAFEETWIECLGDLGRYRMAIEETDHKDRETWAAVARSWYNKAADKNPSIGRLYHHLAILARPNALQQLYYYSRSLNCVRPFPSARESILTLLDPILGRSSTSYPHTLPVDTNFIQAHGVLFKKLSADQFEDARLSFQSQLDHHIGRVTAKWKDQGTYIAITNLTGLFDYGNSDSILRQILEFYSKQLSRPTSTPSDYDEDSRSPTPVDDSHLSKLTGPEISTKLTTLSSDFTFSRAYLLTMTTLSFVLRRSGDKNVLPHVHILLAFFHSFASIHYVAHFLDHAPWKELATFLNELLSSEKPEQFMTGAIFPTDQADALPLPEDYHVRGQIWSQWYFPENWFAKEHDEEDRYLELASTTRARTERVLLLGHRLSTVSSFSFVIHLTFHCYQQPRACFPFFVGLCFSS